MFPLSLDITWGLGRGLKLAFLDPKMCNLGHLMRKYFHLEELENTLCIYLFETEHTLVGTNTLILFVVI